MSLILLGLSTLTRMEWRLPTNFWNAGVPAKAYPIPRWTILRTALALLATWKKSLGHAGWPRNWRADSERPDGVNFLACWAEPHKEPFMNDHVSLPATRSTGAERSMAKRALNLDQCATCDNSRLVPHPDPERAESLVIPCPDCSQITRSIRKKYLAAPSACPWCGGAIQADAAPEVVEAGVATQEIDCTECNRRWCDVYRLSDMRRL
jgi:predicted RNA-binding Zn-ribbon protein involved in translation (DUF1610 family)